MDRTYDAVYSPRSSTLSKTCVTYLVEVFTCSSHLLPGLVEQLDADAEELLEGTVVGEEHGVEVVAVFTGCGRKTDRLSLARHFK